MGETFFYRTEAELTWAQIEAALRVAERSLPGFQWKLGGEDLFVELSCKRLPDLPGAIKQLNDLGIDCRILVSDDPRAVIGSVMRELTGAEREGHFVSAELLFAVDGEDRRGKGCSLQIVKHPDECYWILDTTFCYLGTDHEKRRELMVRICQETDLPLTFDGDNTDWHIREDSPTTSNTGSRQTRVYCSLGRLTSEEFMNQLFGFAERFGSGEIHQARWGAGIDSSSGADGLPYYREVVAARLPATCYSLHMEFPIGSIEAIESCQCLCGSNTRMSLPVAGAPMSEDGYINVDVIVTSSGYSLEFESRFPVEEAEIAAWFGLSVVVETS